MLRPVSAASCLLLAALAAQDPTDVLAHYQLDGRPAVVTRTDVAVEMAFHQRRMDLGTQGVELLVDSALTRRAAEQKQLMPKEAEVREYWNQLQQQLKAAGQDPRKFAAVRNTGEADWLRYLAVQLAQERLVRAELELGPRDEVSGDMLRLWVQEARRQSQVVVDPDQLPPGVAARVDGQEIPMIELGFLLLRTSEDHEVEKFVHQVVYLQSLDAFCKPHGIDPTPADLAAAVAARAAESARDPRYRGVPFEQLLQSQGQTLATLQRSRVFRAKVQLQQLVQKLHPDSALDAELASAERPALLERIGARRRLGLIFLRALEEPNPLIPLDFAAATARLAKARERLQKERFEVVARIESQDPGSKAVGGDVGWHHRRSTQLPDSVLAAAYALPAGGLSEPLREHDGVYLIKVLEVEPEPTADELRHRLREHHAQALSAEVLANAKLVFPGAAPAPTTEAAK